MTLPAVGENEYQENWTRMKVKHVDPMPEISSVQEQMAAAVVLATIFSPAAV